MAIEKKKTFTYSGKPSVHKKAKDKAEKEGFTFSEKVEQLLLAYNDSPVWKSVGTGIPLPPDYVRIRNVAIIKANGKTEKIKFK